MAFNGQLNQNEIYSAIYNMIISQSVESDLIGGLDDSLTDIFRVDGSQYGDTKLFYDVQLGHVNTFGGDSEAANLLSLDRAPAPNCTAVVLDQFKQIRLTVDNFLSKRAWGSEGIFGQFTTVLIGTMTMTKRVYFVKRINVALGIAAAGGSLGTAQNVNVPIKNLVSNGTMTQQGSADVVLKDTEAVNRLWVMNLFKAIDDLFVKMKDVSGDYNDLGYERSFRPEDFIIVWNNEFVSKIRNLDIPMIFDNSGFKPDYKYVLPSKYFGKRDTTHTSSVANARTVDEIKVSTTYYRPGDVLPTGTTVTAGSTYTVDADVICKIIHKDAFKIMSGFEAATEFINARSLTQNHYLTFGFSDPLASRLPAYPYITVKQVNAS